MIRRNLKGSGHASLSRWRRKLLQRLPKNSVCAEIGVWRGGFSVAILQWTEPKILHLIDPWEFQHEFPDRMYGGSVASSQADMDAIYESVSARLGSHSNVEIHRGRSENILERFDDGSLDWIYIDGNHYYEYVYRDIELSLRKVRSGGLVTGDDYNWGKEEGFPVRQAIHDVVARNNLDERQLEILGSQFLLKVE